MAAWVVSQLGIMLSLCKSAQVHESAIQRYGASKVKLKVEQFDYGVVCINLVIAFIQGYYSAIPSAIMMLKLDHVHLLECCGLLTVDSATA